MFDKIFQYDALTFCRAFFMSYCRQDIEFMRRAIELAKRGGGFVHPNPHVGCVVVKNEEIIAEGFHERYGGFHAERNALTSCKSEVKDAILYVTLEPCCHYGKTPPCTDIIIEKGIKKVFVGILDPNPLVSGNGVKILKKAGIQVETGICEDEIRELNKVFLKYITTKLPYVIMKTAMTLDGKIATNTGDSKWVTNEDSRKIVHRLRSEMAGVVIGIGTAVADDPMLTCRLDGNHHQPTRIVVDSRLSIPIDSQLVTTSKEYKTIVATTQTHFPEREKKIKEMGAEILHCNEQNGHVDIKDMLVKLGAQGIDSLLLEGGGTLNSAFLEAGCIDEVYAFIAPKIVGGSDAPSPVSGNGIKKMYNAITLQNIDTQYINGDILIKGRI